jgi:hypothetical protein
MNNPLEKIVGGAGRCSAWPTRSRSGWRPEAHSHAQIRKVGHAGKLGHAGKAGQIGAYRVAWLWQVREGRQGDLRARRWRQSRPGIGGRAVFKLFCDGSLAHEK